jgi:hypothetical protein
MKSKYDLDETVPTSVVRKRLREARKENRIYVIANILSVLKSRKEKVSLTPTEKSELLGAVAELRKGRKQLARWLPLGYQLARFISLVNQLCGLKLKILPRDRARVKRAAAYYKKRGDWHSKRQLHSLMYTAKYIGIDI